MNKLFFGALAFVTGIVVEREFNVSSLILNKSKDRERTFDELDDEINSDSESSVEQA